MRNRLRNLIPLVSAILLAACSEGPTGTGSDPTVVPLAAKGGDRPDNPTRRPTLHYARVAQLGELVDGTASSASRSFAGVYRVTFPEPIEDCAGTVSPAISFPGSGPAGGGPYVGNLRMGGEGRENEVGVEMVPPSGGTQSSAFFLVLVCP